MRRSLLVLGLLCLALVTAADGQSTAPKLVIALSSFRDRPLHPRLYFYEHDGTGQASQIGAIKAVRVRVDTHPSLPLGARYCAYASELENNFGNIRVWDLKEKKQLEDLPGLRTEAPEMEPCISHDGKWMVFAGWNRKGGPGGWNLFLYDFLKKQPVELPCNTDEDERSPAISGEGRWIVFVSGRPGGQGLDDLYLFDRQAGKLVELPSINTPQRESDPAISADGRFIAFTSDRPGGEGSRDIYLYDRQQSGLVALPGLNGIGIDQTPALSPDARYLAFVAERITGLGERDVYLYDREKQALIPTPGLNTKAEDFDPALTYREK